MSPQSPTLKGNKTVKILRDAEDGGYGIVAPIVYNIGHIIACIQAAERKRSPLIIQMFPWAITVSDGLIVHAAALAASKASVPISIHLDHAQDEALIRYAADTLPFDSIMVDMSHYEKEENLAKTKELVRYCKERGIATEAEPGRIEGGEDGIADTADLEGMLTTLDEVDEFIGTGVDFLAPAFGNVHGEYGPKGPQLEFDRLDALRKHAAGRVRIVLHGTNSFSEETMRECIRHGVTKVNVNKLVLDDYHSHLQLNASKLSLTQLIEEGIKETVKLLEWQMDVCWSTGKASATK
ncbi:fructose-bisphosphate aldolase [Pseudovirgaria hyperparasitica]|uniref:Fructose-bisphosphate aldolase n=1 Tax=Pseudovirgaria hyperparasitica TaxID=470096 RepID=A0A6A6WKN7_9PEZI|nr:fructose-bisphosphate aldolase [Pseudovirgaria hyperparasitica]KAF2762764.1 fructose-bisphosphate aldolase [Pseudovirgaria hyperparasitica]